MLETRTLLSAVITVDDGDAAYAETGTGWAAGGLAGGQGNDYRTIAKPPSTAATGEQIVDNTNSSKYSETGTSWVTGGLAGGYQSNYRAIAPVGTSAGTYEVVQDENEASLNGPWGVGSLTGGYNGDYLWCDPTGPSGSATYTFANVPAGNYDIYARWVPHANRTAAAPYTISVLDNGTALATQSGTMAQNAGGLSWAKISFSTLNISGSSQSVSIRLDSTTSGYVIADGIRLAGTRTTQPGTAAWNFSGLAAGTYEVSATWSSHTNRASNAPFTVTTAAETKTASIDQRVAPSGITAAGTTWKTLGQVSVAANGSIDVSTTNVGANGYVIADAIRIVALLPTGTASWTFTDLEPGTYTAYASWVPHSNRATNARYSLAGGSNSTQIDQTQPFGTDGWASLFTFTTTATSTQSITLSNAGANGYVIADSVRLISLDAPIIADQARSIFVGEPNGTTVGLPLIAIDPQGDSLTWSIISPISSPLPPDFPFTINPSNGQLLVQLNDDPDDGTRKKLDTEINAGIPQLSGKYHFTILVGDGNSHFSTANITVAVTGEKVVEGATILMRGKSPRNVPGEVGGFMLQGGDGDVLEAHHWIASRADAGDYVLIGNGAGAIIKEWAWNSVRTVSTPLNSVISIQFTGDVTNRLAAANNAVVNRFVSEAEAIFIRGGDQGVYLQQWLGTQFQTGLQSKVGMVTLGGSSAGMHLLSGVIMSADPDIGSVSSAEAIQNPYNADMVFRESTPGDPSFLNIPMFSNMVFDTHFWERDRIGRTAAYMAVSSATKAIAADGETALLIDLSGVGTVVGTGYVYFLDRTLATNNTVETVEITSIDVWKVGAPNTFRISTWDSECYYDRYFFDVFGSIPLGSGRNRLSGAVESRYGGMTTCTESDY